MEKTLMKDIVNLAQNRGFVYPGSDIYGGLANTWDYGPYGSMLKENIKNLWLKEFVQKRTDMVQLDSSILLNPKVWVASWHVGWFSDPLIDDKNTKERFRADKLLEDYIDELNEEHTKTLTQAYNKWKNDGSIAGLPMTKRIAVIREFQKIEAKAPYPSIQTATPFHLSDVAKIITADYFEAQYWVAGLIPEAWELDKQTEVMRGEWVKNPNSKKAWDWTNAKKFNLMFQTSQWVTADSSSEIYLRPETAQGIFINFAQVARTSRKKIPFGIAQVGKAFRNEITPGNFIFRTREFEQMEIEYFCEPGTDLEHHAIWKQNCMDFLTETLNIKSDNIKLRDHEDDELSLIQMQQLT